jgi:MFS family permease
MSPAEIVLALFAVCNSVRVFAYLPQIVAVARDRGGASAISYTTWGLFAVSHLSTVGYAVVVVDDWRMAFVFTANALCCLLIVILTAWKRARFTADQKLVENRNRGLTVQAPERSRDAEAASAWRSAAALTTE